MSNTEKIVEPYSIEAEQSVLGALMLENDAWDKISSILVEQNFYNHTHRIIFREMQTLFNKGLPVDLLTLDRALKEKGVLEDKGRFAYLAELSNNTPSTANIVAYAKIIKRDSQSRALFALGNNLRSSALQINSQKPRYAIR